MIVTIDGPSGTGKTSTARLLASQLGFLHVDTGAMYRAFTYWILEHRIEPRDKAKVLERLVDFDLRIDTDRGHKRYFVSSEEVTLAIRSDTVTAAVSVVSAYREVREAIVAKQRELGHSRNSVFEGRDLGTVVFPDAEVKIYLTARPEVRAHRRFAELKERYSELNTTADQILVDQEQRDIYDSTREHSPLRPADDAYIFDTSDLSLDAVVAHLLEHIRRASP